MNACSFLHGLLPGRGLARKISCLNSCSPGFFFFLAILGSLKSHRARPIWSVMANALKRIGKILLLIIFLPLLALGVAWLAADHWNGEMSRPSGAEAGLADIGWPRYGNDQGGSRYSNAGQVNRDTLDRLAPVWIFRTGESGAGYRSGYKHSFQATPVLAGNTLYFSTAFNRVFAVDAESGAKRWQFDAGIDPDEGFSEVANRGVAYWADRDTPPGTPCRERIFAGTLDARLIALDAVTGKRCVDFANDGEASLKAALRDEDRGVAYPVTSPPVVINDTVVLGSGMIDNWKAHLGLGTVWAYDARSGELRWKWHAIPRDPAADNVADWRPEQAEKTGTANVWAPLSVDEKRNLVFAATGSASPDYYGGERSGNNRHANSLLALDAASGDVVWSRQLVHHDLWDYDIPSQPVLADIEKAGVSFPVVIQATKMGLLFSFHRETGEPFFPVKERAVPASDIPGEKAWPTQPFPVAPPPLVPHHAITTDDAWGLTPWDRRECRKLISDLRSNGIYTPPSLEGTVMIPGNGGGSNWGSIAWDSGRQLVIANTNHLPFVVALIRREDFEGERGSGMYRDAEFAPQLGTPYGMRRKPLMSSWEIPCVKPPWGTLAAVDMVSGEIRWQVPLGTTRDLTPLPFGLNFGTPNLGGPLILANGLVFIAAALDDYLRAYDIGNGEELWRGRLPAGGQATPMTYQLNGRQYIVIATGGHGSLGTTSGDYLVAFALAD
jgi:quinoprotein glucose dehydrogenase